MTSAGAPPGTALPPARRWVLAVGVVFSLALIGYGVLSLVGVLGGTTEERRSALPATGGRLVVSSESGGLRVLAGDVDEVQVVATLRFGLREPTLEQESGPGGVRLSASCPWFGLSCSVDYQVTVPRGFAVEADSSAGDVEVSGVDGAVRLESSAGDLRGDGLRAAEVRAESSAGDVRLRFAEPPDAVEARTSAGDVEVALPRVDGDYQVSADSSAGDVTLGVGTNPSSERRIRLRSSAGDIRVAAAPPA